MRNLKKLYLPLLLDASSHVITSKGASIFSNSDGLVAFFSLEEATEFAKQLAMGNAKGKVAMFEAIQIIEPREVVFATKHYNESGELVV